MVVYVKNLFYLCGMFIREVKKQRSKNSKTFYQYNLVQTARIDGKVKQTVILYLGSDPVLKDKTNRAIVLDILKSRIFRQPELSLADIPASLSALGEAYYQKYLVKYGHDAKGLVSLPPDIKKAEYHNVDIEGLAINDVKSFGGEHLCAQVLDKLQLKDCLSACGLSSSQVNKALISIAGRALFSASEHKTAQILEMNSELQQCFAYDQKITHKELYTVSDLLYAHKQAIDTFLYSRVKDIFGLDDKLVIFDISNTYFETSKPNSKLAKHGRSKEKRSDCPLVIFTGVIDAHGFIRHSRIYEGNKADTTTIEDLLTDLEAHTPTGSKPTVVMDAGIADQPNLDLITSKGYHYVCVSRHQLKEYELSEKLVLQSTNRDKEQVKLGVFQPEGYTDTWMYVQSDAKRKKEQSIQTKLHALFEQELESIKNALSKKGGTKRIDKVWERIGRAKEKYKRASANYQLNVSEQKGKATAMRWELKAVPKPKEDKTNGVYFIRTNYENPNEEELWQVYNTIREVESTFRCLKSDLNIRPVHHQNDQRIEAHIYLTLLAYQLVNTIRHMLKKKDINQDWKNITRTMATQTIQTILIPTDKKNIHLRKPSVPIKEVKQIYEATNCKPTQKAVKKYVVYH